MNAETGNNFFCVLIPGYKGEGSMASNWFWLASKLYFRFFYQQHVEPHFESSTRRWGLLRRPPLELRHRWPLQRLHSEKKQVGGWSQCGISWGEDGLDEVHRPYRGVWGMQSHQRELLGCCATTYETGSTKACCLPAWMYGVRASYVLSQDLGDPIRCQPAKKIIDIFMYDNMVEVANADGVR